MNGDADRWQARCWSTPFTVPKTLPAPTQPPGPCTSGSRAAPSALPPATPTRRRTTTQQRTECDKEQPHETSNGISNTKHQRNQCSTQTPGDTHQPQPK